MSETSEARRVREADGLPLPTFSFCIGAAAFCLERILRSFWSMVLASLSFLSFFLSRPEGLLLLSGSTLPRPAWWDPGDVSTESLLRLDWALGRMGKVAGDWTRVPSKFIMESLGWPPWVTREGIAAGGCAGTPSVGGPP